MSSEREVTAVEHLDLGRYVGDWFEIARLPLRWEDAAASRITASYSITDTGKVCVDNRCLNAKGEPTQALGEATPVEGEPGKLTVSFLPKPLRWLPFTSGDYWVLKVDPDYQIALVGTPDRENLWVLARSAEPEPSLVASYLDTARQQGFELSELIRPVQDGGMVTDEMLADAEGED